MNKTLKSFSIVTGFSVVTRLLSFVFKIWMSRSLGAEVVGLYQICMSVLILLFTLTAGAPTVLSRKIAEAVIRGDTKRQSALTTASIIIGVSLSVTLCGVFYAFSSKLGFIFTDERCMDIFLIMLPTLITSTLYASIRSWFWGQKRFLAFSSTEFIDELLKIVLAILFAGGFISTLTGAKGIALAFTLSDLLCVLLLIVMFFKSGGRLSKPAGFKEIIVATVPLSATRIISSLTASLTALVIPERLVASGLSIAEATAEYGRVAGMALPLIMAPITIVSALSVVLIPDIAELSAKGEFGAIKSKLRHSLTFALLIASMFFVVYLPLGKQLGSLLFGDESAGKFVSYCSLLLFPIAIAQVTTPMLNSMGCEKNTFINSLLGAVLIIPCIFFLPQSIGIYSMAVGSGLCFTLTSILNLTKLSKKLGRIGDMKKSVEIVFFSISLAVLGLFSSRLLAPYIGEIMTLVIMSVYLVFFMFIFITAFDIVDATGFISVLKRSRKATTAQKGAKQSLRTSINQHGSKRPQKTTTAQKDAKQSRKASTALKVSNCPHKSSTAQKCAKQSLRTSINQHGSKSPRKASTTQKVANSSRISTLKKL